MVDLIGAIIDLAFELAKKKAAQLQAQANQEIGSYQTPAYLKNVAVGSEQGNRLTAPVNSLNASQNIQPEERLGSIAPTPYAYKKDPAPPPAVPVISTCSFCNGLVKDGECVACGGKRCPICGEMNYATAMICHGCMRTL